MDEDAFVESLRFEDLKQRYQEEKASTFARVEDKFRQRKEECERELKASIEDDRRHREVLTLCINPFAHRRFRPYELGYRFLRGAPLYELGVRNFDFLLGNITTNPPVVILGEAKGSVSSPGRVVREVVERREIALKHIDHIKERYLRIKADPRVETVLAISAVHAVGVIDAIVREGGSIIPWMVDRGDNILFLELSESIDRSLRPTMLHGERELNNALRRIESMEMGFNIFPQSHPVTKLRMLAVSAQKVDRSLLVDPGVLELNLQSDLFYLDDESIKELKKEILSLGYEIGLLREEKDKVRLSTRWTGRGAVEEEIEAKWANYRLDQMLAQQKQEAIEKLREKFSRELSRRPELRRFER